DAVLVMNRERLGRFARDCRRTFVTVDEPLPAPSRAVVLARTAKHDREPAQRVDRRVPIAGRGPHLQRPLERLTSASVATAARIDTAERDRFARVACRI